MAAAEQYHRKEIDTLYHQHMEHGFLTLHQESIERQLRALGADTYDVLLPETRSLPLVIQPNESIMGIVYGRYAQDRIGASPLVGWGALVATDHRILLIDKKPMFIRCSEISYFSVSGVTYAKAGLAGTVTLFNKTGNINIRTFNQACAHSFVMAVEAHIFSPDAGMNP